MGIIHHNFWRIIIVFAVMLLSVATILPTLRLEAQVRQQNQEIRLLQCSDAQNLQSLDNQLYPVMPPIYKLLRVPQPRQPVITPAVPAYCKPTKGGK